MIGGVMDSAAAAPVEDSEAAAWREWLRPWPISILAVAVAVGLGATVAASDVLLRPGWFALFSAYNVLAYTVAALLWLRQRPRSRMGLLLLALAGVLAVVALQGTSSSLAFSVGVLFDPVSAVLVWYLILTYPTARLTRIAGAVLGLAVVAIAVGFVPWFFLSQHVAGGTPLARCTPACPANALMVASRPDVAGHFGTVEEIVRLLFAIAFLALLVGRLVIASRPRRRVLVPVYVAAAVWIAAFGAYGGVMLVDVTDPRVSETLGWVLTGARVALPLSFVLALAQARIFAGSALAEVMRLSRARPSPVELERVARDALGDPGFRLALPGTGRRAWSDSSGGPIAPGDSDANRRWRELSTDGRPIAAIVYDRALEEDPELVDAVATAVVMNLETRRLAVERRLILSELHRSQRRLATASVAERRRVEQDLHDSAQQRLIALRIRLDLASERLGRDPELEQLGEELDASLDEIRAIGHGIYPPVLRDLGLGAALTASVRDAMRTRMEPGRIGRYADEVEAAVYFSALEALQNASKHSGPDAEITVRAWEEASELRFEVADNGVGFTPDSTGVEGGLVGMRDRLQAVGGSLEIVSAPGRGTRVLGTVPVRG